MSLHQKKKSFYSIFLVKKSLIESFIFCVAGFLVTSF